MSLAVAFSTVVRWLMTACLATSYCEVSRKAFGSSSITFPLRMRKVRACWASGVGASSTLGGGVMPEDFRVDKILSAMGVRCSGSSRECSALAMPSLILLKPLPMMCFSMCSESDGWMPFSTSWLLHSSIGMVGESGKFLWNVVMRFSAVVIAFFQPVGSMMWSPRLVTFFSLMSFATCCSAFSWVKGEFGMGWVVLSMGDFLISVRMSWRRLSGASARSLRKFSLVSLRNCLGSARASRMTPPPRVPCCAPSRMTKRSPTQAVMGDSRRS